MNYDKQSYRLILESAIGQDFEFVDFLTMDVGRSKKRQIILRHDIDGSPDIALEMAEIDAKCGLKSTFALLLSSPFYNPFTAANIKAISQIRQLGHNIVLHHRVISGRTAEEIKRDIIKEMQVIKTFFPYVQPVFVWHNPPSDNLLGNIKVPGMINAYSASFMRRMHYISDSGLRNSPEDFLTALGKHKFLHMLVHPLIWMSEQGNMLAMISYTLNKIILDLKKECFLNPAWKERFPDGIPEEPLDNLERSLGEG